MGFIAGFANAGSEAIDRRLGQIQQQEDTAYQLVAQRFLDNSRKRTEASAADEARIRSAHTLAEQAGMPEAWTHAYDMLVAGLTPLQVSAKLEESTFSAFDPNSPEAQQQAPTDATASESTQDASPTANPAQQGSRGPNQPASNAVDVSTLTPLQNFINNGIGGIFNRANRTSTRMEQMSQQFRTNMGVSEDEFNSVMNDTFQPQTMTHTGQLVPKLSSGITDYDGVIFVETINENGDYRTREAVQNENGQFIDPISGEPIEDNITHVRTEEELDAINKLITLTNGDFQTIIETQDSALRGISSYMRLGEFFSDPNNANILTGTSGVLAFVEGIGREADTLLDAFNEYGGTDASYTSAREVEDAIIHLLPEGTRDMVGQRAQFLSLMAGAAYELARAQNGSGVLSNRDIAAAFDQIRGNTTNPVVFMQNLQNLANKSVANADSTIATARRLPAIQQMQAQEVTAIQMALKPMAEHMTEDQARWLETPAERLIGSAASSLPDDETPTAIDEMVDPSTDEEDLNTVIMQDETTGVTIHRIENMDGGKMAVKYSLDGQNLLVIEVTRQELNDPRFYELLVQEANNQ